MKKTLLPMLLLLLSPPPVLPDTADLLIDQEDIILEEGGDGGYHLWIRKKPELGSVLLTESTADPEKRLDTFAYRDPEYNPVNGDERRLLNGEFLEKYTGIVDSTPEDHPLLERAFHLFIPYVVVYGYPWSRNGEIEITEGTFLNVKAFSRSFADWEGESRDNPFALSLQREQRVLPDGDFLPAAIEELSGVAEKGGGTAVISAGKEELMPSIEDILSEMKSRSLDLVLVLDTTLSMKDEMPYLKEELVPLVKRILSRFDSFRVGLLYYRDYFEQYLVKSFPFSDDPGTLQANIDLARVHGGKEIPEAVFEALYAGLESYPWSAEERAIILIGDAPPHPLPRGSVTAEMVYARARELDVTMHTIILPQ